MRDAQPKTIRLADYEVPDYLIEETKLNFELLESSTIVTSQLSVKKNPESKKTSPPLELNGVDLLLKSLVLNGQSLSGADYTVEGESLIIPNVPDAFVLECVTEIYPDKNTSLEGLYKSNGMFCTQCEAEGFRKITYYLDRPDVMSVFTTTIIADQSSYPVLLSNGNAVDQGSEGGKHWIKWHDPFKKPAYLFALVAGDLEHIEDSFVTESGRTVNLKIYVEAKDIDKCDHAMSSLKHSMRWDEDVYGREYDLDIFNIVAVDHFNMGAMENKSLNIFNTSCILANPDTTTDRGFQQVEAVVAHEYFHNWSGNRVTCRDWFQLSLKEGFTVYRDAEFSADMGSRTVKRVEDASMLRTIQFAEDAGPMAHPVRPDSYIEISNFYTVTIYEKGAEVVRMIANLLGKELFRKGCDLYFDRHDGQAVTCEDFVVAMEDASGKDLTQFRRWYSQSGTPELHVEAVYHEQRNQYELLVKQSCPATPGQSEKEPFHIPLSIALLGDAGALRLELDGEEINAETSDNTQMVLDVTEAEQRYVFNNVHEEPVPSLLRGFSAPVKLDFNYSRDQLVQLMTRESDGFSRWDAAQQLGVSMLDEMMSNLKSGQELSVDNRLIEAFTMILDDESLDPAMVALLLRLPSEAYMVESAASADVHAIHHAREFARKQVAVALADRFSDIYKRLDVDKPFEPSAEQIAQRSLKNTALSYLMLLGTKAAVSLAHKQYTASRNMTDVMAAMVNIIEHGDTDLKDSILEDFYTKWKHESLVVNQWFSAQASSSHPQTLSNVKLLMSHEAFDFKNPNRVRSLIGAFSRQSLVNFHDLSGAGYEFLADNVMALNKVNPQIASRLLTPLTGWKKFPEANQALMRNELERIIKLDDLSKDVFEVVSKSLAD